MEDAVQHLIKSFHVQLSPEDQELMKQDLIDVSTLEPRDGETYIGYIDRVYREGKAIKDEINIKKKNNLVRVYWDYLNEKQYLTEEGQKVYQQIQEMDESTSFDIATLVNVPQLLTEEGQNFHNNSGIYKGEGFYEMTPKKLESTLKGFIQESYIENHHNKLKAEYHEIPLTKKSIKKYEHQGAFEIGLHNVRIHDNTNGAIYIDDNDIVVGYFAVEKKKNDEYWITALEVSTEFQSKGIGVDLLQIAVDNYHATHLSCDKDNQKAFTMYKKYGWEVYKETDQTYFMKLSDKE
jgi:ribosomal protein S18 acetylase RimI-like enzyme